MGCFVKNVPPSSSALSRPRAVEGRGNAWRNSKLASSVSPGLAVEEHVDAGGIVDFAVEPRKPPWEHFGEIRADEPLVEVGVEDLAGVEVAVVVWDPDLDDHVDAFPCPVASSRFSALKLL